MCYLVSDDYINAIQMQIPTENITTTFDILPSAMGNPVW